MTVTAEQRHATQKRPIRTPYVMLVEIWEEGSTTIHRAASNNEDVIHNGETFYRSDIVVTPPASGDEEVSAKAEISNISRIPGRALLSARRKVNIRLRMVNTALPDEIVSLDTYNLLVIGERSITAERIEATLKCRASLSEPWPPQRATDFLPGVRFNG